MSRVHHRRSAARRTSSSSGKGVSIKRLPGWYGGPARWPSANTALGSRQAFAKFGTTTGESASAQPSEGRTKMWWPPPDTTSR